METGKTLQGKYQKYLRKITREQAKLETKQDKNNANDKKAV